LCQLVYYFNVYLLIKFVLLQEEGSSIAREVALLLQKAVHSELQGGLISCFDISGCNLEDLDVYELLK
jgi:hypothetical protein